MEEAVDNALEQDFKRGVVFLRSYAVDATTFSEKQCGVFLKLRLREFLRNKHLR